MLRSVDKVIMIGCGTASMPDRSPLAAIEPHPLRGQSSPASSLPRPEKMLVVAISQRRDHDTIQAIRHAREQGAKVVAIVNAPDRRSRASPTP